MHQVLFRVVLNKTTQIIFGDWRPQEIGDGNALRDLTMRIDS